MKWPWQHSTRPASLPVLEGYDQWAATYAEENNPIKNLSNEWIEKFLPDVKGKSALDAGCGAGYFCQLLEKRGVSRMVGLDFSGMMIEQARKKITFTELHQADLLSYVYERHSFDIVICALVLGHIMEIEPVLDGLLSSLKSGGVILLSDFHPFLTLHHARRTFQDSSGKTIEIEHHLHLFQDLFQCLLKNEFIIEDFQEPLWKDVPAVYVLKARRK